jgi:hypothetical protein
MALPSVNPERPRPAPPLVWAAALLGAAHVPALCAALPVLGVLRGPLGLVLAVLAVGLAAAAVLPPFRLPSPSARLVFAACWAFLLTVGLWYTTRLRVSGDEPHYLVMAQSLWREHDLDLRDNYERQDWREYTPGPIVPHYGAPRADGRPFPAHSPGLPLLLAPLYALGGRLLCALALTLAGAALALETWRAARRLSGDDEAALLAAALALVPPVSFYSFEVYTELPSALAVVIALRLIREGKGAAAATGAALLASSLPWLHLKMIPAAAALAVVAAADLSGRARTLFVAVSAAMAALFLGYYHVIFGVASPLAIYGGLPRDASGAPWRALAGLFLDRSFGLLPYAPVFLLALAGLGTLAGRRAWDWLLVGAAVVAPVLPWRMWWGGQCPPARFLVPAVPVLALALAARVAASRTGLARWRWPLLVLGIATTIGMAARPAALLLLNRGDRPTRFWSALSGEWPIARYLPSITSGGADEVRVAVIWMAALAALLALDRAARHDDRVDRLFRTPALPVIAFLTMGMAVDGWGRRSASGDGAQDDQGIVSTSHGGGKRRVGGLVGQVLAGGKKTHEGPPLEGVVVADRPAQRGIALLERVEDGPQRGRPFDLESDLRLRAAEPSQRRGNLDADHGSVWTSTERTAGRSRTIGAQVSPPLDEP